MAKFSGKQLRTLRKELGLSQHRLGVRCGVPRDYICQWERGHCSPSAGKLADLAAGLGCSMESLFQSGAESELGQTR